MADTKERILTIALQLFSREGYEAVSMRMIADALGITKGALYKHYESKRDIFDHIVARMRQADASAHRNMRYRKGRWQKWPTHTGTPALRTSRRFLRPSSATGQRNHFPPSSANC